MARPVQAEEEVAIHVYSYSKFRANRYVMLTCGFSLFPSAVVSFIVFVLHPLK